MQPRCREARPFGSPRNSREFRRQHSRYEHIWKDSVVRLATFKAEFMTTFAKMGARLPYENIRWATPREN
jgi:hypothetical protein